MCACHLRQLLEHACALPCLHLSAWSRFCAIRLSGPWACRQQDMDRQQLNVFRMRLLGAEVREVAAGTATLKVRVLGHSAICGTSPGYRVGLTVRH